MTGNYGKLLVTYSECLTILWYIELVSMQEWLAVVHNISNSMQEWLIVIIVSMFVQGMYHNEPFLHANCMHYNEPFLHANYIEPFLHAN